MKTKVLDLQEMAVAADEVSLDDAHFSWVSHTYCSGFTSSWESYSHCA